jgi:small-conductance mechanosensitive channel
MRINLFMLGLASLCGLAYAILYESPSWSGSLGLSVLLVVASAAAGVIVVRLISWATIDVAMRALGRQPSKLLRLLVDTALYGVTAAVIIKIVAGMDISLLVAGSAVITAVLGFALQATLENLFSGVAIQLEQPFAIGDFVRVGDVIGEVETVTWRATHIRTDTRSRLIIPNSQLSSTEVEVLRAADVIAAREIEIHVPSAAPPGFVSRLIVRVLEEVPNVADDPPPEVDARRFHARQDAIVYEVSYVPIVFAEWEATEGTINERVWYALQRHGISMSLSGVNPRLEEGPAARPTRTEVTELLRAVPILTTLDEAAIHVLAEAASFRPYTDGEVVRSNPVDALQIVIRGTIEQYGRLTAHTEGRFAGDRLADLRAAWDPAYLAELARSLAPHVGPVSKLLVRRAAVKTTDTWHLYSELAEEIADEAARVEFMSHAPAGPSRELHRADCFNEFPCFFGLEPQFDTAWAGTGADLVEIPSSAFRTALRQNPAGISALAQAIHMVLWAPTGQEWDTEYASWSAGKVEMRLRERFLRHSGTTGEHDTRWIKASAGSTSQ